ncbi:MAG: hypothetical protein ACLFSE_14565 [Spirochaetia bacterium]
MKKKNRIFDREILNSEEPCRAEVKVSAGAPRLFINGRETVPFMALSTSLLPTAGNFLEMGINLLCPIFGTRSFWKGPGQYDFSSFFSGLEKLLALHPEAYFFPRLHMHTPIWWIESHPDETAQYGLPTPESRYDMVKRGKLKQIDGGHYMNTGSELREVCFASHVWREDTAAMLRALVREVEEHPMRSRMTGYFLMNGRTGEWNYFGGSFLPGYSVPMEKLTGPPPPPRERIFTSYGLLRDPAEEGRVMEFYRNYHRAGAEAVVYLAEQVKAEMARPLLCGTFFGYLLETPRVQDSGYLATRLVLDSPHIDLIACPYSYQNTNDETREKWESDVVDGAGNWLGRARGVGGDAAFRVMKESVVRRGKLFILEIDPSTHLDVTDSWRDIGGSGSNTEEGTVKICRRDIGKVYSEGIGGWIYDFGPLHGAEQGWFSGDAVTRVYREGMELLARRSKSDLSSPAEILLLGDMESFIATGHWLSDSPWPDQGIRDVDFFNHWFLDSQNRSLQRIGAPVDYLHRFDFTKKDAEKYRLILVPNTFLLRPEEIASLHDCLKGSGAAVIWYYAPGLLTPEGIDQDQMSRLTGFRFRELLKPGPMLIKTDTDGLPGMFGIKSPRHYHPRFSVLDTDCTIFGEWSDSAGTAFARKQMDGWTSVYAGTAPLPAEWLRKLAAEAGVKLWSSRPDIVNATRDTAMVVACSDGERNITFPNGMVPAEGGQASREFRLRMSFGDVGLFQQIPVNSFCD